MKGFFLGGARGRVASLFQREAKFPLEGRNFYGGARGRFCIPFAKGSEIPLAGRKFMEGPGGGFRFFARDV